ncbi:MAG: hypothetical protein ACYSUX_16170 [Planctomycetota bacterium]|jgi:dihydropteroate synthase
MRLRRDKSRAIRVEIAAQLKLLAMTAGVSVVRVHDVAEMVDVLNVSNSIG